MRACGIIVPSQGENPGSATNQLMADPRLESVPFTGPPPPGPTDDERQLIEVVLRKDRKAAAEFVSAHVDAIYGYVRHRLMPRLDRVEDLVHDVFVAAFTSLAGFRGTSSLRTWLLGIARHKVEDYYRQRLNEPDPIGDDGTADEPADDVLPIEERIDRARAAAKTQRVMLRLPESYAVVLLWRYWENRSIRDIANATKKTEKSVERLLARARTRFRELWNEEKR
jgi:RNA polymerase sigma-70 factor, ECF subfamily